MALMLAAALLNTLMAAGARHLAAELPVAEIAFFRHLFGAMLLAPLFLRVGLAQLRTARIGLHGLRAGLNICSMLAFFTGLTLVPLATVTALSFTSPLFAMLGAVLLFGEPMRSHRWIGLALGFAGAMLILRPGVGAVGLGEILVLGAALIWAAALLCIKSLARTDSSLTIALYAAVLQVPLALAPALFVWAWPSAAQLGLLLLVALAGTIAQMSLAQAFREADASVALPVDFSKLLWASVVGYVLFAETPDLWAWIGGAVVFFGVIWVALRERWNRAR